MDCDTIMTPRAAFSPIVAQETAAVGMTPPTMTCPPAFDSFTQSLTNPHA